MMTPEWPELPRNIVDAYQQGRKILVLTECTEHLAAIEAACAGGLRPGHTAGRSSKKQWVAACPAWALAPGGYVSLLSPGKLVGEDSTIRRSTRWCR
ncbi:MAG: hypothetical protein IPP44_00140 [Ideonella sp.]|nr:hypothetical protein [Ideonella sp.]